MTIADINWRRQAMSSPGGSSSPDRARQQELDMMRRDASGPRPQLDIVMIVSKLGQTQDITTGTPPKMKAEYQEKWKAEREVAELERLMGWR